MTTFSEFAARTSGVGVNWILSIGPPSSAAVYVYGTVGTTNVAAVDARIVNLSSLNRGFPADMGMQASEITVTIDNTDGEVSWLLAVAGSLTSYNSYNFTLSCEMYDIETSTDYATKTIGVFELLDWPTRGEGVVIISLVDHALGRGAALVEMPTVRDWCAATDAARPTWLTTEMLNGGAEEVHPSLGELLPLLDPDFDPDAPLPLWFGSNPMRPTYVGADVYVLCAVAGAAGALPTGVVALHVNNHAMSSTVPGSLSRGTAETDLWVVYRSATITKGGRSWHIMWMLFDLSGYGDTARTDLLDVDVHAAGARAELLAAGVNPTSEGKGTTNSFAMHTAIEKLEIYGSHWSHPVDDVDFFNPIPAVTVIEDLFEYYTQSPQTIDGTSFDVVRSVRRTLSASGELTRALETKAASSSRNEYDGDLPSVVRAVCGLAGFDVFFAWDGSVTAAAMVADLATVSTTPTALDETTFVSISDRVHGAGERYRPFNRAYIRAGDKRYGPVDTNTGLAEIRQIVEREFDGSWMPTPRNEPSARDLRGMYIAFSEGYLVRPIVTVRTGLNGLNLELGDYVSLTWTAFVGHPTVGALDTATANYTDTAFRVEGIRVDLLACITELELVYVERMFDGSTRPYILDNETTSTRATGSGGRTATLTNASTTVTFSSGNLTSDGVVAGDQLIVLDATEATASFGRNRVLEIVSVDSATTCTVGESDFGSGGPFVLSTWEIRRSYLTFRANAANYGKTCESDSEYSDDTEANKLLDG